MKKVVKKEAKVVNKKVVSLDDLVTKKYAEENLVTKKICRRTAGNNFKRS